MKFLLLCLVVTIWTVVQGQTDEDDDYKTAYEELRKLWEEQVEKANIAEQLKDRFNKQLTEANGKVALLVAEVRRLNSSLVSAIRTPTKTGDCPRDIGFASFCRATSSGCYCVVTPDGGSYFEEAKEHCRSHGMELVSMETSDEKQKLVELLRNYQNSPVQHSLNKFERSFWTSGILNAGENTWKWSATGQPITLNFQRTSQSTEGPNLLVLEEKEPFGIQTLAFDKYEEQELNYICEDLGPGLKARRYDALIKSKLCPADIGMNSTCKRIPRYGCYCLSELYRNVIEAKNYCNLHGMELISIETEGEWNELLAFLNSNHRGRRHHGEPFWTSGREDASGEWRWTSTGFPLTFTNWGQGNPRDKNKGKTRWLRINFRYVWVDTAEEDNWHGFFICES